MLCTDEEGETLMFRNYKEAEEYGEENCQEYQIIKLQV
jgi:hypothetical protein